MQFIHPSFLWALAALAVPIIIHLFHFRRFKKVYFTNVHLLKEIKEETSTRSRLRNLLILLMRCLALAFLVFAFAQPIISNSKQEDGQSRAVSMFLDNSFSMQAEQSDIPLITIIKDKGKEIINTYEDQDVFLILTSDVESKHQRHVDKETALSFIDEITITPEVTDLQSLSKIMDRLENRIADYKLERFYLSDFQSNITLFEAPIDTSINVTLIPTRAVQENNVSLSNIEWMAPIAMKGEDNQLIIEVSNYGNEVEEVELRMSFEDQERPLGTVRIPPKGKAYDTTALQVNTGGWHEIELNIDDYPIAFDNRMYGSFEIKDELNILSIYQNNSNNYLKTALEGIEYYNVQQKPRDQIRYEEFAQMELIILDDLTSLSTGLVNELVKYVRGGGNVLIFPSANADNTSYNSLLAKLDADRLLQLEKEAKTVSDLNTDEFIFSDVFLTTRRNLRLPTSQSNWKLQNSSTSNRERLLTYRDGASFLNKYRIDKGNLYLCTAALNASQSDLVLNAEIWVPMLYKMAIATGTRNPLYYTIGEDEVIASSSLLGIQEGGYLMTGREEFIPGISGSRGEQYIDVRDQIEEDGQYELSSEGKLLQTLSYNYSRQESDVVYEDMATVQGKMAPHGEVFTEVQLANLSEEILEDRHGTRLWRWCLILALVMLLIETLLIRLWRS